MDGPSWRRSVDTLAAFAGLTLGSDPARCQTEPPACYPGLLAATRTGFTPAGDGELTNSKIRCYAAASPPALLGAPMIKVREILPC